MSHLATLDVVVLFSYLALIVGIGTLFYRPRADLSEYFVASRQIPAFVVVVGLAASYTSSISYLGTPSYAYRENLVPMASLFAMPLSLWVVSRMFLPFFFKLNVITCYEYLDRRFGRGARLMASIFFLVSRMLWLVLVSFGTAVALKYAIHVPVPSGIESVLHALRIDPEIGFWVVVLGAVGAVYTILGGMRAVMWTDLLQFCMLCFGLFATLFVAAEGSGKSLPEMWRIVDDAGHTRLFDFHFSWYTGNFWAAVFGGFSIAMSDQGLDQIAAQRYLSAKSLADSQRSALLSLIVNVPFNILFYGAGLALFVLYGNGANLEVTRLMEQNPDALITFFFFDRMPAGVLGLMLATILAATLSCLTAGMNSLSASTVVDLYAGSTKTPRSNEELTRAGRWVTVVWAVVISAGAAWVGNIGTGIMELSYLFLGLAASLNLGIFLSAMLIPRAGQKALLVAIACGVATSIAVVSAGFHWLWFSFFPAASILAYTAVLANFFPTPPAERTDGLTWWTRTKPVHATHRAVAEETTPVHQ